MHLLGKLPFRKLAPLHLLAGSIRRPNIRPSRSPLRKPIALKSAADWFTAFERLLTPIYLVPIFLVASLPGADTRSSGWGFRLTATACQQDGYRATC